MVTHMKTTVEIPDAVLADAKSFASKEGTTLKALVEEGLRRVLDDRKRRKKFRLRDASFKGDGLCPEVADWSWEKIRDLIYEGRGGLP